MTPLYLLDTNHASRIMDGGDSALIDRLSEVDERHLCLCTIVAGELCFMVEGSQRKDENASAMDRLFSALRMLNVTQPVAREYGHLKNALVTRFASRDKRPRAGRTLRDLGVSDNDLWIAAVARSHGATLVTQDRDFDRIAEVAELPRECWLSSAGPD